MNLRRLLQAIALPALSILFSLQIYAQTKTITGRVTDAAGKGIAGVTVSVNGTSAATTDETGTYTISASNGALLIFSSVGFERREISVGDEANISITLQTAAANLSEVVVVGYGTQRRKDLTGSITTVSSKDFQKGVIPTPEQLIAGKVAGVQITTNGGAPGSGSTIRIRGGASLSASNDPLIVVDGVPLTAGGIAGSANALSLINPNDIESMNVLKDASATAIYGSRASNGVIIITTKKGAAGKPQVSFSTQLSAAENTRQVEVLSADQFRELVNARGSAEQRALLGQANTNWQNEIYQTAFAQDNNLSVRGSLGRMPYRASVGFLNQDGVLKGGNMKRTSGSLSLSPRFFDDHLRVDINLKGALTNNQFANEGAIGSAVIFDPTQNITTGNKRFGGYFEWLNPSAGFVPNSNAARNPIGLLNMRDDQSTAKRSIGNAQFDYKFHFLPDLRANLNLGYDIMRGEGNVFVPDSAASQYLRKGQKTEYKQGRENKLMEAYLNYVKDIKSIDSRVDVMAGYSYQDFITNIYNFPDYNANGELIAGTEPNFATDQPQNTLISYYGRLNYGFKSRYLLTATLRRDGSSRFAEENRWGLFPSVAVAWNIRDEAFLRNARALSNLKLRASYGVTGQQEGIGLYDYISYYNLSSPTARYQLGNEFYNMYRPGGYYANRKWEETATWNVGLDYGFLNNRISGTVDAYYRETTDLLNDVSQPAGTNFSNRTVANVGSMVNKGIELTINTTPVRGKDWNWDLNYNITYNKNEITNLTIAPDPTYAGNEFGGIAGGVGNNILINSVNHPRGTFYVYQQVYGQDGKPIENLFVDRNKDGVINERDRYQYQQADPQLFMGMSSNVSYRNWNAGFVMRANFGNYVYNNVYSNLGRFSTVGGLPNVLNNASINYLETGFAGGFVNQLQSDYYVQNASFLRMDNINLGYNVGKVLRNAALRINATVQNVFVVTNYKGLDPEIGGGIDNSFYPRPRTYVLGFNLDF